MWREIIKRKSLDRSFSPEVQIEFIKYFFRNFLFSSHKIHKFFLSQSLFNFRINNRSIYVHIEIGMPHHIKKKLKIEIRDV